MKREIDYVEVGDQLTVSCPRCGQEGSLNDYQAEVRCDLVSNAYLTEDGRADWYQYSQTEADWNDETVWAMNCDCRLAKEDYENAVETAVAQYVEVMENEAG